MNNIIINGDLYIKVAPSIIYKNISLKKSTLSEGEMLDLLTKNIDMDVIQNILSNISEIMEKEEKKGNIKRERIEDYSQNKGVYRIFASENVIFLISEYDATGMVCYSDVAIPDNCENIYDFIRASSIPNNILDYRDINDVNQDFIRLYDFIINADYVGCYLEPKIVGNPRYRVLYTFMNVYLLQNVVDNSYMIISNKCLELENYILGEKFDGYYDKLSLYQDIFKQKNKNNLDGNSRRRK